ncbi:MAG TPA: hypothetical protein DCR97_08295 [Deltaproteobacteria bacterium]|nr:hypothetical protein [Deltaproteobacteria bacterium]
MACPEQGDDLSAGRQRAHSSAAIEFFIVEPMLWKINGKAVENGFWIFLQGLAQMRRALKYAESLHR